MNCENCGKKIEKTKKFCSRECYHSSVIKTIKCKHCEKEIVVGKNNKKIYCSNQCAANDVGKLRAEKAKKTLMKRYGVIHQSQLKSVKEKIREKRKIGAYNNMIANTKKTLLKKYGNETYNNSEKNKQTKLEKYGDETYNNRNKFRETMIEKYGSACHPDTIKRTKELSSKGIIGFKSEKYKNFLKRNNVTNISQLESVKEEKRKTIFSLMYYRLFNSERLKGLVKPLFTKDEYDGSKSRKKKYKFQCIKCNNEFTDTLYSGKIPRCIRCYPLTKYYSDAEKEIVEYLKSIYTGKIIENNRFILSSGRELDIFIPDKNVAIEFNGLFWHSEIGGNKDKKYHLNKTLECENQNIRLIQIFEDEWLYKQNIVKSRLKHILGLSDRTIFARETTIKEITNMEKNNFLNQYHIQGEDKSHTKLGAFYENELVAVMTFGGLRISTGNISKNDEYELIRFASSVSSSGLANKLLTYFIKKYNPNKIISYADRRWTYNQNNLYDKLGFNRVSDGTPNYWYIKDGQRFHRFGFRKNVLREKVEKYDSSLTEWQNMQLNDYDRIWDSGNFKYEKKY